MNEHEHQCLCPYRMNAPPTKRLRGLKQEVATAKALDDPFEDDEYFTQDDLDEIDIIASQAIPSAASSEFGSKPGPKPMEPAGGSAWYAGQSKSGSRATSERTQGRENKFGLSSSSRGMPSREPLGEFRYTLWCSTVSDAAVFNMLTKLCCLVVCSGNRQQQQFLSDRDDAYSQLEAQHAELKRKVRLTFIFYYSFWPLGVSQCPCKLLSNQDG